MRTIFDPAALAERQAALEKEMQAPGFWDDQEHASRVTAEHARVTRRLTGYRELESELDDLETLEELAGEDESLAA